ncbi:hypothetical protein EVAR_30649_1 [Eumeta japonica]|uniref:Uncharacterized protein n=1 Tax=Eumeta variegata TaxID=151549 RepID=A0A4C1VRB9_EUMVA|nr:hypothetical protein EVAR_30649_1 [Eumeta japonica]
MRFSNQLIEKGLIINEQFDFRHYHSCPQQAFRLIEYISEGLKVKRKTVTILFDVAKAFDRIQVVQEVFSPCESDTPVCPARGRPIMGFSPPSPPLSHGENYKKKYIRRSCTSTAINVARLKYRSRSIEEETPQEIRSPKPVKDKYGLTQRYPKSPSQINTCLPCPGIEPTSSTQQVQSLPTAPIRQLR